MRRSTLAYSFSAVTFLFATAGASQPSAPARGSLPTPQAAEEPRGPQGQPIDPEGKRGISPFMIKILEGNAAYAARDFEASVAAYREAIVQNPEHPLGHYMLGQAQLAAGQPAEAEAAYQRGIRFAGAHDELHAKLLFVLAGMHERQGRFEDAKKAYAAYAAFCRANPQIHGYPDNADARIQVIEKREELAKQAALVKKRAEDREKDLGLTTPAQASK